MKKMLVLFLLILVAVMPVEAKKKKYPNGDYYEGGWKKNSPHGEGTMIYANGDKYVGTWEYGKKNGQGVLIIGNGQEKYSGKYSGTWNCDTLTTGKAEYLSYVATGTFNSKFQLIKGRISFINGDYREGLFKDNKLHQGKLKHHKNGNNPEFAEGIVEEGKFIKGIKSINTQFANGDFNSQGKLTNGEFIYATKGLYSEGLIEDGITSVKVMKTKRMHKCTLLNFEGITDGGVPVSGSGVVLYNLSDTTSLPQSYCYEAVLQSQGQWVTAADSETSFRSRCSKNNVVFENIELDKIEVVFHQLDTAVDVTFSIKGDTYHKVISTLNEDVFWSNLVKETESVKSIIQQKAIEFQQKAIERLVGHVFEGELVSEGAWGGQPFRYLVEWRVRLEFVDENNVEFVWDAKPKINNPIAEQLANAISGNYKSKYQYRDGKIYMNEGEDSCRISDDGSKIELYWEGQLKSHGYLHQIK